MVDAGIGKSAIPPSYIMAIPGIANFGAQYPDFGEKNWGFPRM
jgi:hypothetical protein